MARLRRAGHDVDMDYTLGSTPDDVHVDVPPYTDVHLRTELAGLRHHVAGADRDEGRRPGPGRRRLLRWYDGTLTRNSGTWVKMFEHFHRWARRDPRAGAGRGCRAGTTAFIGPSTSSWACCENLMGLPLNALRDCGVEDDRACALIEDHKHQQAGRRTDHGHSPRPRR